MNATPFQAINASPDARWIAHPLKAAGQPRHARNGDRGSFAVLRADRNGFSSIAADRARSPPRRCTRERPRRTSVLDRFLKMETIGKLVGVMGVAAR
jgi:hypothetical protein